MLSGSISWFGNVKGFENSEPIWNLARYATDQWLSNVHENQMIDLLRCDLRFHQDGRLIEVEHTYFFKSIRQAYESRDTGEYEMSKYFAWTCKIGMALASGMWKSLGFYFTSIIIIGYPLFSTSRTVKSLSVTHFNTILIQLFLISCHVQHDTFSCGVLAFNALAHYFLPAKYNLINSNAVRDERLRVLLEVVKHHSDQTFRSIAHDFRFTFSTPKPLLHSPDHDTNFSPDVDMSPPPSSPPLKKPQIVKEKHVPGHPYSS
ncbi:hypothetical protein DFH29DRAFT_1000024 [Suillus ampliporus]|nr:hypothetical protein DFH29DRAFT_1000024 [Suillus ampliporus]